MCSTPFGINEWITSDQCILTVCRLACSTPFGINEWITRRPQSDAQHQLVLNAFRHQRMDHACRSRPSSASRRAQRLSASTNGSLSASRNRRTSRFVLNAFRHQRMDHHPLKWANCGVGRAQRLSASTNGSRRHSQLDNRRGECSTPFGINEWITVL